MRGLIRVLAVSGILLVAVGLVIARPRPAEDHDSFLIIFKDGHRQSLAIAAVERIDLKAPAAIVYKNGRRERITGEIDHIQFSEAGMTAATPGRSHYVGKWEVENGVGGRFFITLEADGDARKTTGSPHGTWTLVDGEARISWNDGWHDVIAKVGTRHEKRAYEPGRSFEEKPSNVTYAKNTAPKPI